jgi:hypothetical protein
MGVGAAVGSVDSVALVSLWEGPIRGTVLLFTSQQLNL